MLKSLLVSEGYDTRSAANGKEAPASIAEDPPDLILLDVVMPGLDGRQVAKALKELSDLLEHHRGNLETEAAARTADASQVFAESDLAGDRLPGLPQPTPGLPQPTTAPS